MNIVDITSTDISEVKEGFIIDFISGIKVKATPEELEAVQVYSKILVEDFGYPKDLFKQDHNTGFVQDQVI